MGLEHSIWLGLMRDRLEIIRRLLSEDGSLWITIDDNEVHYLKVLCDEVFGRANYMTSMVWEKDKGRRSDTTFSVSHDYILVYAKNPVEWAKVRNLLERTADQESRYKNPDNDPRGPWLQGDNGTAKSASEGSRFPVTLPSGRVVIPPPGRGWAFSQETLKQARAEKRVYFGAKGDGMPIIKRYLSEVQGGATNSGDLVLDSFAGSGTTGAVAHKMGRRWIMVELGEHCHTHIIPRLKKVIDGEDKGGVTESVNWRGGGGFRYYRLAPSLIVNDRWSNPVINPEYNAAMLAEALAKLEGFNYAPSETHWWQHGHSSERDFIYVTTQNLSAEQLQALSDEVGPEQSLLVCCAAFHGVTNAATKAAERWPNLTLKKIPKMVLARCEWGHDDYSLNVANLPMAEPEPKAPSPQPAPARGRGRKTARMPDLFGDGEGTP
jgi:adenine-specific DNA-methyltransferase